MKQNIFVFGSNLAGLHGAGSARAALEKYGAQYGKGIGFCGNSYAIPTKDRNLDVLPLDEIKLHVRNFLIFAKTHPDMIFNVVKIGCGLAGYTSEQIAPMFKNASKNVVLHTDFLKILEENY